MRTLLLTILLSAVPLSAQQIKASSTINESISQGVTVSFSYEIPAANAYLSGAKVDPAMVPVKAIWLWGDEAPGAKKLNFTEAKYGEPMVHHYAHPGTYGVTVVVIDAKKRLVAEESVRFKISEPFEIVLPEPVQPISRPE